jgi:heme-degrading monooxygenase HmoA
MKAIRIATYAITDGSFQDVLDTATGAEGVADIYRGSRGFESFGIADLGGGRFASLTIWADRDAAEAAVGAAATWVKEALQSVELVSNAVGDLPYWS